MGVTYFKRFQMEFDLRDWPNLPIASEAAEAFLPMGYEFVRWHDRLLDAHAEVKFRSFHRELDAQVFPCLGDRDSCRNLMHEISRRNGFLPEATWLIQHWPENSPKPDLCGTIQGVCDISGVGAIQNVGVTAAHRNKGLGRALLAAAIQGFGRAGMRNVFLEVTAQNASAVHLYQNFGFRKTKVVYKASEVAYA